jgi:hypothetical protein
MVLASLEKKMDEKPPRGTAVHLGLGVLFFFCAFLIPRIAAKDTHSSLQVILIGVFAVLGFVMLKIWWFGKE